ncbi:MAG: hypothetical protein AVDCRST_MAG93-510 [uncultured Chloroflexia bacterium]|uniref:Uncharacterized protein n=1 Tax=uncultured Chloroflexia bacterium TaxID=1672391 RepID=A0A6J4HGF9_9CHLR|nr:MAG: hypothetical protein AVDCRST_MAG93-510 [uncultured Chloroflexia bacterium]
MRITDIGTFIRSHLRITIARFFAMADEGAGARGQIGRVANTSLCQFEPEKDGDG